MRKLTVQTFVTLDGVVQDPGGFGETERGGWALDFFDDTSREHATESLLASDTFLLGRRTFEIIERASGLRPARAHRDPGIARVNAFGDPALVERFGFPRSG
jgi:hypothetical protein